MLTTCYKRAPIHLPQTPILLSAARDLQHHSHVRSCSWCHKHQTHLHTQVAWQHLEAFQQPVCQAQDDGVETGGTGQKRRECCWGHDWPTHVPREAWGVTAKGKTYCRCRGPQRRQCTTYWAFSVRLNLYKHLLCNTVLWFNPSWQLNLTQLLTHLLPPHRDGGENWKSKGDKTRGLGLRQFNR